MLSDNDAQSISSDCDDESNDESMIDVMHGRLRLPWAAAAKKVLVVQPSSAAAEHFSILNDGFGVHWQILL